MPFYLTAATGIVMAILIWLRFTMPE